MMIVVVVVVSMVVVVVSIVVMVVFVVVVVDFVVDDLSPGVTAKKDEISLVSSSWK